jgi:4-hydroxyphenylacetate 3-monooxygenase
MATAPIAISETSVRPFTGAEYLESIRDDREVWIYGERVKDVTQHPAFRNSARSVARLYDALYDPARQPLLTAPTDTGNGGFTHPFYKAPHTREDLVAARTAIAHWQGFTYGFMGRSPDYKASFLATLGVNDAYYGEFQGNAKAWYRKAQERVLFLNHAIVHPPVDRTRPPDEVADVCVHVEKETDAGLVVSGAKVVATGSALTHYNFVAHYGLPIRKKEFGVVFIVPMNAPGLKLVCRQSYEMVAAHMGSPFDYPLSSRFDENDAIMIFDHVLVPWENLFVYDAAKTSDFIIGSGFLPRAMFHGCIRLAVKLDFLSGLFLKAMDMVGYQDQRNVQVHVGEVLTWRQLFWDVAGGMIQNAVPWVGDTLLPCPASMDTYRMLMVNAYGRVKELFEQVFGSSLIYLCSNVEDLKNPDLRPFIDRYVRGSGGRVAEQRIQLMKLVWDAIASEFGGRHELYERNYAGNWEDVRLQRLMAATATGEVEGLKGFVDRCLGEYDTRGWIASGYHDPGDVNVLAKARRVG